MTLERANELLLQTAILGTHRQPLEGEELAALFRSLGIEEAASAAEKLLEAAALVDRLRRGQTQTKRVPPRPAKAEVEHFPPPLLRTALGLCLSDIYRPALGELLEVFEARQLQFAPEHLPAVLTLARALRTSDGPLSARLWLLAGSRGRWLAAQHPDWKKLLPPANWAAAYAALDKPGRRAALLSRWRSEDPAAARQQLEADWPSFSPKQQETMLLALQKNLSADDADFLQAARLPKRQGVRQVASQLLLALPAHPLRTLLRQAAAESRTITAAGYQFSLSPLAISLLQEAGYAAKKGEAAAEFFAFTPPSVWSETVGEEPLAFIRTVALTNSALLLPLLKAILAFEEAPWRLAYCQWLLEHDRPQQDYSNITEQLYAQLRPEEYQQLAARALRQQEDAVRKGSVLRRMSQIVSYPWPNALSQAAIQEFLDLARGGRGRMMVGQFYGTDLLRDLPYRIDTALFPQVRQQLMSMTERSDQLGHQATKILQIVDFRRRFRQL